MKLLELAKQWSYSGLLHKNINSFLISLLGLLLGPVAWKLSALALGFDLNLSALLMVAPAMAIVTLLPINVAGIGGSQLVAAALFQLLGLNPQVAASASLLQSTITIAANMLVAGLFVPHSLGQLRTLFKRNA